MGILTARGALVAVAAGVVLLSGCSAADRNDSPSGTVTVSTGSPRGVYYAWAEALARQVHRRYPRMVMQVQPSSGSVQNLRRLAAGQVTLAVTTEDAAAQALAGSAPFGHPVQIRALTRIHDDYVHLVTAAGSPVRELADLRGRRVAVGSAGSGTALVASRLLSGAGLRVHSVPLDVVAAATALREGRVDAMFWSGGLPTAAMSDLARAMPIRLVPLGGSVAALRARFGPAYRAATVPAGTYGLRDPVPTLASANLLVSRQDADPGAVRAVLAAMFSGRDSIAASVPAANAVEARSAISTGPVPLHPAAAAYYRRGKP